jgi:AcrR family transcriptional regulator
LSVKKIKTVERILETTLDLFNRFGEPNVAPSLIASTLGMSPGNLYYHFPSKAELINALFDRYTTKMNHILPAASEVQGVEDAWFFMHTLFEYIWEYRFLYRDLNDLLSKNRQLEKHAQTLIQRKNTALQVMLAGLRSHSVLEAEKTDIQNIATCMVALMTYWLSYEYVLNPRQALEINQMERTISRGAFHVLGQISPYLHYDSREHLQALTQAYL